MPTRLPRFALSVVTAFLLVLVIASKANTDTTLQDYVDRPEAVYSWEIRQESKQDGGRTYELLLTSQTWKEIVWTHQLTVAVPDNPQPTGHALLMIFGGKNQDGKPEMGGKVDETIQAIVSLAAKTGSPVAVLRQVPNQPLFGGMVEDDLISYTFVNCAKTGERDWPLLLPMVKSAVKAMDAIQDLCEKKAGIGVEKFVVTGSSKRGWTTWLTGAIDPRVAAIAPRVIDTLNFEIQMPYQLEVWGDYSEEIEDYSERKVQSLLATPQGRELAKIVDPYHYRESLDMPKLILIGTNDEYWPVDAVRHYFDDLKGEKFIVYVPNAGHSLGDGKQAMDAVGAFFATVALGKKHPGLTWKTARSPGRVAVEVEADDPKGFNLYMADSPSRDFRKAKWATSNGFLTQEKNACKANVALPTEGYQAFYVEALFDSPIGGTYSKCTRVFVANGEGI